MLRTEILPRRNDIIALVILASACLVPHAALAESVRKELEPKKPASNVGAFLDLEWRLMGLGGHVSHGPGFAAGATFFDGLFRLGIGGFGRPGPINPATFEVPLPNDQSYKGRREVNLKSDGGMVGLHLGLSVPIGFDNALSLQVPLTVGYGGFGFYLHDEDRVTPDGRRVSEWENELFDGRDSFLGVVLDGGLRLSYAPRAAPWIRPYAGVAFTLVPGFETLVRNDYSGFSGVLGIEIIVERQ